jgi:hypothetical protein
MKTYGKKLKYKDGKDCAKHTFDFATSKKEKKFS